MGSWWDAALGALAYSPDIAHSPCCRTAVCKPDPWSWPPDCYIEEMVEVGAGVGTAWQCQLEEK